MLVGMGVPGVGVPVGVRVLVDVDVLVGGRVGAATFVPPGAPPSGESSPTFTMGPNVERGVGVGNLSFPLSSAGVRSQAPRNNTTATITAVSHPALTKPRRERGPIPLSSCAISRIITDTRLTSRSAFSTAEHREPTPHCLIQIRNHARLRQSFLRSGATAGRQRAPQPRSPGAIAPLQS